MSKFESDVDKAVYEMSLDGGPDEVVGSATEAPGTWAGLMRDGKAMAERIEDHPDEFPDVTAKDIAFLKHEGRAGAIVTVDTQGFVSVSYYAKKSDLDKDWKETEETLTLDDDEEDSEGDGPSQSDLDDFEQFCEQATDRQLPNIYEKEKDAGRAEYARVARAVMRARGFEPNARRRGRPGRHRPNTSIADRRKAGVIEGLTKAEMDSMEIRIPTFDWKQVGGDMDPGAHGGMIAQADGQTIDMLEIQSVTALVGEGEAKDVGFPFWSKEGSYDLDDLSLSDEDVQGAIEYAGLGENLLEMTPEQRAVAIAEACMSAGHRSEESTGGWAKDVLGSLKVVWWGSNGKAEGYEYIADEDDEFRREILGEYWEVIKNDTHVSWFADSEEDEAIEEAERVAKAMGGHVQVKCAVDGEVIWDSEDQADEDSEHTPNRRRSRGARHTRNPRRWPTLMEGDDPMSQLLDDTAESMEPSGRGDVPREVKGELSYTDDLVRVVFDYENALRAALEEVVDKYPPIDDASADVLFDDDAPYAVLMTLRGEGVGIWDGRWDEHYDKKQIRQVQDLLTEKLGRYADSSGSGRIYEAMEAAVWEAMRRAEYTLDEEGYRPLKEGEELGFEFQDTELTPERVEEIVSANDIPTPKFWDKAGSRRPLTRGEVDKIVAELGGRFARNSARKRFDVFLNQEMLEPVYMPHSMSKEDVKRVLVSEGYDERIRVDQPPERRSHMPAHYRTTLRENRSWPRSYMNDLPDSAFLYIEPGGSEDAAGRTVPRTLRHFPYKGRDGKVDLAHLRNALSRIPQSKVPEAAKRAARSHAEKLLAEHGGSR